MKVGRLKIIEDLGYVQKGKYKEHLVKALCDCGNITVVRMQDIKRRKTKSCGCLNIDKIKERMTTHGKSHTRLYSIWKDMRKRCNNPNATNYHNYGGRGIKVTKDWDTYTVFESWALKNGYDDTLSIDRINVDGDYEPDNCRWVDSTVQNRNTRKNKPFLAKSPNGKMYEGLSQADFADKFNLCRKGISACLNKKQNTHQGWKFKFI